MVCCAGLALCANPAPRDDQPEEGRAAVHASTRGLYGDILRVPDARALIGASAASQLGDWLYNAVLAGLRLRGHRFGGLGRRGHDLPAVAFVLLGPVGGVIADRYDRRSVLLAGDLLRCLLMLGLAAVVAGDGPVLLVIALTALASAAGSAERPAALALLPRLVGESRFGPANALLHTVQDLGVVFGPAIGAVLLVVAPDYVAFIGRGGSPASDGARQVSNWRPAPGGTACDPTCSASSRRTAPGARRPERRGAYHRCAGRLRG